MKSNNCENLKYIYKRHNITHSFIIHHSLISIFNLICLGSQFAEQQIIKNNDNFRQSHQKDELVSQLSRNDTVCSYKLWKVFLLEDNITYIPFFITFYTVP